MRRQRHVLILRRSDHKRDALGAVFLGAISDPADIRSTVERYLGPPFLVRAVEREGHALRVTVECARFQLESHNVTRMAQSLAKRGRLGAASDSFAEALKLDPLNAEALKAMAALHASAGELNEAEDRWIRAGEIRGYDGEMLRGLAAVALRGDRGPTARQYLEEALIVHPDDAEARRMLDDLHRQAELRFNASAPRDDPGDEG
jgi:tetratricopeptide (TPR) repeat protein